MWACASLIHLSKECLKDALFKLTNATKPGGVIYFSMKIGDDITREGLKTIYYYDENVIDSIASDELMLEKIKNWKNEGGKNESIWMNYIYKKKYK